MPGNNLGRSARAAGAEGKVGAIKFINCPNRPIALDLNLLFAPCSAQYQPIQGHGGIVNQQNTQQIRPLSAWDNPQSYIRIRIAKTSDFDLTYPLIAAYVEHPDLAFTVDELVVDEDASPGSRCDIWAGRENPRLRLQPSPVREDAQVAIERYVHGLGLGNTTTKAMLEVFDWKKRHLKGEAPDSPKGLKVHDQAYASAAMTVLISLCSNITTLYLGDVGSNTPLEDYS
ncbi:hypothetical protein AB5N19_01733 [Seiridium cardinale]